ncbi:hypothetical protein [Pseudomonas hamedanensis]|nr:hypothetical protein [Pseudomonas hamedanensis]
MSNTLKLPLTLLIAFLLLGGCMPVPDGLPELATVVATDAPPKT